MNTFGGIILIALGAVAGVGLFSRRLRGVWKGGTAAGAITSAGFAFLFATFGLALLFDGFAEHGLDWRFAIGAAFGLLCIAIGYVLDFGVRRK